MSITKKASIGIITGLLLTPSLMTKADTVYQPLQHISYDQNILLDWQGVFGNGATIGKTTTLENALRAAAFQTFQTPNYPQTPETFYSMDNIPAIEGIYSLSEVEFANVNLLYPLHEVKRVENVYIKPTNLFLSGDRFYSALLNTLSYSANDKGFSNQEGLSEGELFKLKDVSGISNNYTSGKYTVTDEEHYRNVHVFSYDISFNKEDDVSVLQKGGTTTYHRHCYNVNIQDKFRQVTATAAVKDIKLDDSAQPVYNLDKWVPTTATSEDHVKLLHNLPNGAKFITIDGKYYLATKLDQSENWQGNAFYNNFVNILPNSSARINVTYNAPAVTMARSKNRYITYARFCGYERYELTNNSNSHKVFKLRTYREEDKPPLQVGDIAVYPWQTVSIHLNDTFADALKIWLYEGDVLVDSIDKQ